MENTAGKRFHFDNSYWESPRQFDVISLYQIGDLSCRNGFEVGQHIHPCYEITCIQSGKGVIFSNDVPYPVSQGDIFISLPGDRHNLIADKADPFRYLYLGFAFSQCSGGAIALDAIEKTLHSLKYPVVSNSAGIEAPMKSALQELYKLSEYSRYMLESYILQVIILTYRSICGSIEQAGSYPGEPNGSQEIIYTVVSHIDQNLHSIESLVQVAETLNYSYSYLSHIFREGTGITLQSYYNGRRMAAACEMLKGSYLSISDIAEKLRYKSVHSFSKAFKNNYGISPAQYKLFVTGKSRK
jgi:AraC-like DNA-binding protein